MTLLNTFIIVLIMFQVWNLIDLVLPGWFLLLTLQPSFMILPGTEGMAGYRDYSFHFRKFLNGIVLSFLMSGVLTLVSLAVEWVVW